MTANAIHEQAHAVAAVRRAVAKIDNAEFSAYRGGWPNQIGAALVDAVFSMRATYDSRTPGVGVLGRVRAFRDAFPEATDDLRVLAALDEADLRRVMGNAKTAQRYKSVCVIEAAGALTRLHPPVLTSADVAARDVEEAEEIDRAYTSVRGLGRVTAEYFRMLLGVPGVKADVMVIRFVNAALAAKGIARVGGPDARELIVQTHGEDPRGVGLTAYEHAIWRTRGVIPVVS